MPDTSCQRALERVLTYLRDDGVVLDAGACRQVLRLVERAMIEGDGSDLPARCIERVSEYFERPAMEIPPSTPPLERGHLGYYPYE